MAFGVVGPKNPIVGSLAGCCAGAASAMRRPRRSLRRSRAASFNHLVGAPQELWWNVQVHCMCRFEIYNQLETRWGRIGKSPAEAPFRIRSIYSVERR